MTWTPLLPRDSRLCTPAFSTWSSETSNHARLKKYFPLSWLYFEQFLANKVMPCRDQLSSMLFLILYKWLLVLANYPIGNMSTIFKHKDKPTCSRTETLPPGLSWRPSVCSNIAIGIPTFLERPATRTFFPRVGIPGKCEFAVNSENLSSSISTLCKENGQSYYLSVWSFPRLLREWQAAWWTDPGTCGPH